MVDLARNRLTGRIKQWEYYTKAYPVWATNIRKAVMAGYDRFNEKGCESEVTMCLSFLLKHKYEVLVCRCVEV